MIDGDIAIQGIKGSYSDEAAGLLCGEGYKCASYPDFAGTLASVVSGLSKAAVVPVRNSTTGSIEAVERLIRNMGLKVRSSAALPVRHVLAGPPGTKASEIRIVRSHPEALKQCAGFLGANPRLRGLDFADTASAVRHAVLAADKSAAAIGSRRAAEMYGAAILAENIADSGENETVFCLVTT